MTGDRLTDSGDSDGVYISPGSGGCGAASGALAGAGRGVENTTYTIWVVVLSQYDKDRDVYERIRHGLSLLGEVCFSVVRRSMAASLG